MIKLEVELMEETVSMWVAKRLALKSASLDVAFQN